LKKRKNIIERPCGGYEVESISSRQKQKILASNEGKSNGRTEARENRISQGKKKMEGLEASRKENKNYHAMSCTRLGKGRGVARKEAGRLS